MGENELRSAIGSVKNRLELEKMAGIREMPFPAAEGAPGPGPEIDFKALERTVEACTLCDLHRTRTNAVFGAGNPSADLMFIGEAPGMDEDLQGVPFVGRAGQLLTKIIEAMGMKRPDVFIANVLKCRPPNNRNPLPTEIITCRPYLKKQVAHIKPKVICALGKFAAQTLLNTEVSITRLRGKFHDYDGIPLMPTFHPAYLLRNPQDKRLVWEDMKKVMGLLK